MILNWKFHNVSNVEFEKYTALDFELENLQGVNFWIKNFTTRQILSVLPLQFARFSCVHHNRARFGNVLIYVVVLFS